MIVLVLGGARSGKSAVAEARAATLAGDAPVSYLATAVVDPADTDMAERVAVHQARRPPTWTTREVGADLVETVRQVEGVVLVDGLGAWLAASGMDAGDAEAGALTSSLVDRAGDTVVVSDEVGLGVHPSTEAGRTFRDRLGLINQAVAAVADEVLLIVAGRALPLERVAQ